jgi:hypothetical protein
MIEIEKEVYILIYAKEFLSILNCLFIIIMYSRIYLLKTPKTVTGQTLLRIIDRLPVFLAALDKYLMK